MTAPFHLPPKGESSIQIPLPLGGGRVGAVLFDMDGVLFDSMPNHAYAWSHAMTQFGLEMTAYEAYLHEGRTGSGTINILAQRYWGRDATEEEIERIYAAKADLFNTLPAPKPMTGALEALTAAKNLGCMIVLVTGSGQELMVTGFDVKRGKPDPEPYLMGLQKAGIKAEEAIVVENAPLGVQAAKGAGIFTIAANTGPLEDDILKNAGADIVVPGMKDVARLFTSSSFSR